MSFSNFQLNLIFHFACIIWSGIDGFFTKGGSIWQPPVNNRILLLVIVRSFRKALKTDPARKPWRIFLARINLQSIKRSGCTGSLHTSQGFLWNVPPTLTANSAGSEQLTAQIIFHSLVREETVLPGPATDAESITTAGLTSSDTMEIMPILLTVIPSWNPGQELTLR